MKIKNKRVLVSGGAGSIGSELVRQLAPDNKIFVFDSNETATFDLTEELSRKGHWVKPRIGDVRDRDSIRDIFEDFKPQMIFHAAALKHVSPMEMYPGEAIRTNIIGTFNVLEEAKRWECVEKFVFISTDKAVSPKTVMGASKLMGEIMTKNSGKGFIAVRFGNVIGSRGSVVPIWQGQIDRGEPVTVTDPLMERFMMTIPEACELVIQASQLGEGGEVFVLDMGRRVNVLEIAEKLVKESRHGPGVAIVGKRPGEQLVEEIMSEEEEARAIKSDKFFIIK